MRKEIIYEKVVEYKLNKPAVIAFLVVSNLCSDIIITDYVASPVPAWNNQIFPLVIIFCLPVAAILSSFFIALSRRVYWRQVQ